MRMFKYFINYHLSKYGKILTTVSLDTFSKIGGAENSLVSPLSHQRGKQTEGLRAKWIKK